jgi:hypothetical protein
MVRAILEGRKTMTRRVIKPQPCKGFEPYPDYGGCGPFSDGHYGFCDDEGHDHFCPYGQPGDRLWVRETWDFRPWGDGKVRIAYGADGEQTEATPPPGWNPTIYNYERWRPSIFMPRWASRISLEVTAVRVEHVQDISEEDAKAEGVEQQADGAWFDYNPASSLRDGFAAIGACPSTRAIHETRMHIGNDYGTMDARTSFRSLWDSINAKRDYGWDANPWVWVIGFPRAAIMDDERRISPLILMDALQDKVHIDMPGGRSVRAASSKAPCMDEGKGGTNA